jgi:hypothetical protein
MCRCWEVAHVGTGLGHNHFRASFPDPGDGADEVTEGAKRLDQHLNPGGQLRDLPAPLVNSV